MYEVAFGCMQLFRLNPQLNIYTHNAAVSNKTGWVHYDSDIMKAGCNCKGCCGGIAGDKKR